MCFVFQADDGGRCFCLARGLGDVCRRQVRRRVGGVVGSSGNDRLVRVAVQEADDDFVADSRQRLEAILPPSPALAASDPRFFYTCDAADVPPSLVLAGRRLI